ncbi:flippase [Segatella copri]|uniref:Flippase n=1 Tax=Segatella copri TaxID=165179 RepID=A0AAW5UEV6_9BACT|nr:flippase [Segatella copri]MCW4137128.1 flippase [Segatella copri]MCW4142780.1 flippase [Segatella copri]MCW4167367.1 flippase [Segatella copri]
MAQSVKVNYILNLINTGTQMLFPLITFPYVCRVIEADGIGQINFFQSIISYISLFTCLGIPMYAIREIARNRSDVVQMNRTAMEILLLHSMLTLVGYAIVAILCLTVPQIQVNIPLFLILSLTIFFTAIGCEWFYQGIEDFKYITIRGLIIKTVSVVLLFIFVKSKTDLLYYGCYTVFGVLGGNIFNFFRLRKYIHRENIIFSELHIKRHIKPVLKVFSFSVVTSIYLQLNTVLLGFLKNALAVGYFAAATKVMQMLLTMSVCLGSVMMPRASHLIAENKEAEFNRLIQKSYDFTLAIALPMTIGLIFCAPSLITALCGVKFEHSILPSQIIAPIILMVAISNVFGIQVLFPKGKINIVTLCCGIGAVADLILNLCLIPLFSYIGTSIAYLGAEVATTVSMYFIGRRYIPIIYFKKSHLTYALGCVVMAFALYGLSLLQLPTFTILLLQGCCGVLAYFIILCICKDEMLVQILSKIKR